MKTVLTTLCLCLLFSTIQAKIFYVKFGKTGKGTSWADASGDLNAVLFAANYGDEVWVSKGTYTPTNDHDRKIPFIIYDGVKVYGGFIGDEVKRDQRDIEKNRTILSGEIGALGVNDNSFTVVYFPNVSSATLLDGFTIRDGYASKSGKSGSPKKSGGGVFIDGGGVDKRSMPIIANCIFTDNYGRDGGAIYNCGMNGGKANPLFKNCLFVNNRADLDGGAFFNDSRNRGQCMPRFKHCTFSANTANYGGAILNYGSEGHAHPTFESCNFIGNTALIEGGAAFNVALEGFAELVYDKCKFDKNKPIVSETLSASNAGE